MAFAERVTAKALMRLTVMAVLVQLSYAAVYKVGDSAGWTTIGNIDYKTWAATKTFEVGDVIVFEYNAQFHNVMRVTHAMYKGCNASAPLQTFTTGSDSINITSKGHHFFLCGAPGHCQAGQKVDINVLRTSVAAAALAPTPETSSAHSPSSSVPSAGVPGPISPSSGFSLNASNGAFNMLVGITMVAFAVFVSCFN